MPTRGHGVAWRFGDELRARRGRGGQALTKQHTFQENKNRANWGFDDLTYISTAEMYVKYYP
mgnify:CR=1 FL=1